MFSLSAAGYPKSGVYKTYTDLYYTLHSFFRRRTCTYNMQYHLGHRLVCMRTHYST